LQPERVACSPSAQVPLQADDAFDGAAKARALKEPSCGCLDPCHSVHTRSALLALHMPTGVRLYCNYGSPPPARLSARDVATHVRLHSPHCVHTSRVRTTCLRLPPAGLDCDSCAPLRLERSACTARSEYSLDGDGSLTLGQEAHTCGMCSPLSLDAARGRTPRSEQTACVETAP
jgi:hypothetical protein